MQADMDEVVHVRLQGRMAELLAKLDPALYSKYIVQENGRAVIYVRLLKALYGTLRAALLFWEKLSSHRHYYSTLLMSCEYTARSS
jgi:hypothetical protein